ncbi:MAG TPA: citrate synthase [Spirochaetota bacterium]|nr:citrate synthase [Spirochaetota bacterium]
MDTILHKISTLAQEYDFIPPEVIKEKNVKLGLRNPDGTGVVAGITTKGSVIGYRRTLRDVENKIYDVEQCHGELYYCGYNVSNIVDHLEKSKRFGFEEITYLLLTGTLPTTNELDQFTEELSRRRMLSREERKILMEDVKNDNQMYGLHSFISHMSRLDDRADSTDIEDVTRQCVNIIAKVPSVIANNYNITRFRNGGDLIVLRSKPELGIAENFLYMLTGEMPDPYEALLFDIALILHAEHGGGNNSTFTVRVVSSSGANTYMSIAAGVASLSGHLHGGANESVDLMMEDMKAHVSDWGNENEISDYLKQILDKKAGDGSGKLYGFGHAVYTISDPRAIILKKYCRELARRKERFDEFLLFEKVEEIATHILSERKGKTISANVDYYSGFLYSMLGIPRDIFTPVFAMARTAGWSAHRLEQIVQNKIIRPAYITPRLEEMQYREIDDR